MPTTEAMITSAMMGAVSPQGALRQPALLSIPREIRDQIYDCTFDSASVTRYGAVYQVLPPKIAAVCKQIRNETRAINRQGHHDWYHRPELRRAVLTSFWSSEPWKNINQRFEWDVIVDTPLHDQYKEAILSFRYRGQAHKLASLTLSAVKTDGHQPHFLMEFIDDERQYRSQASTISCARLLAEVLLRTEGRVEDPMNRWKADLKRGVLWRIFRQLTGDRHVALHMCEDLSSQMTDASDLASMMQRQ